MPEVGIGFKLHGDATAFERAVDRAKEKTHELHHEVRGLNQTVRLLKEVSIGFGLVEVFNKALEGAKKLREESEKNGTALDANVAAAARLADTIERVKENAGSIGAKVVGGISNFFEKVGDKFRGGDGNLDQAHEDEERTKRAEEMREKGEITRKKIEGEKEKDAISEAKGEEKIKLLLAENLKLHEDGVKFSKLSSEYQEDEYQAGKNNAEIKKILAEEAKKGAEEAAKEAEQRKKIADEIKRAKEEQAKKVGEEASKLAATQSRLEEAKSDRGKLSLQELANIKRGSFGTSIDAENAGAAARDVQNFERQANQKRLSGDVTGANELFSKADDARKGLEGFGHGKDVNPFGELEKQAADQTAKLEEINSTLKGKFVSL